MSVWQRLGEWYFSFTELRNVVRFGIVIAILLLIMQVWDVIARYRKEKKDDLHE